MWASVSIKITVDGLPEVKAALEKMPAHIRQMYERPALEDAAQVILDAILAQTPRKTGKMAGEIGRQTSTLGGATSVVIRPAYKRVKYTHLIEFGTRPHGSHPGISPRNFFNSAVDAKGEEALGLVEGRLGAAVEEYWASVEGGA